VTDKPELHGTLAHSVTEQHQWSRVKETHIKQQNGIQSHTWTQHSSAYYEICKNFQTLQAQIWTTASWQAHTNTKCKWKQTANEIDCRRQGTSPLKDKDRNTWINISMNSTVFLQDDSQDTICTDTAPTFTYTENHHISNLSI